MGNGMRFFRAVNRCSRPQVQFITMAFNGPQACKGSSVDNLFYPLDKSQGVTRGHWRMLVELFTRTLMQARVDEVGCPKPQTHLT